MFKIQDLILGLFLRVFFLYSSYWIFIHEEYREFIFAPFVIVLVFTIIFRRSKKTMPYVKDDFKKLGYELISEKAPSILDYNPNPKPTVWFMGHSIERYKYLVRYNRNFICKNAEGKTVQISAELTKQWNGQLGIKIRSEKGIR